MVLSIFGVGFAWFVERDMSPEEVEAKEKVISDEPEDVRTTIANAHGMFNTLLGYGMADGFDFEYNKVDVYGERDAIKAQLPSVKDDTLKEDLEDVVKLINKGYNDKDVEKLLYAHRILHDLDMTMNGYVGNHVDKFGYSHFDGGFKAFLVNSAVKDAK
jgi:hypothetical protein